MPFFRARDRTVGPAINLVELLESNPRLSQSTSRATEHYVTLFDSNFLPQGLSLYYSLVLHGGDFVLWVLCVNQDCLDILKGLNLPRLRLLDLSSLETPELLSVKPARSRAEYCWTLTPFAIRFVFEADSSVERVTYLDADVFFFKSPQRIFQELESVGKSVLITDHAYAPDYDQSAVSGQYCVQFVTFVRDKGETVRQWWEHRCIEWCGVRSEDGKFGDQKYLESFEPLFPALVHVLQHLDLLLAPWNACRFPYSRCVLYHFHSLRLAGPSGLVLLTKGYKIPRPTIANLYVPYAQMLASVLCFHSLPVPKQASVTPWLSHYLFGFLMLVRGYGWPGSLERHVATLMIKGF
jgi:hypothetical protein